MNQATTHQTMRQAEAAARKRPNVLFSYPMQDDQIGEVSKCPVRGRLRYAVLLPTGVRVVA